jgi:hypothetical protein
VIAVARRRGETQNRCKPAPIFCVEHAFDPLRAAVRMTRDEAPTPSVLAQLLTE